MKCIEVLSQEHGILIRLLKLVKAIGANTRLSRSFDRDDGRRLVGLLNDFLDSGHELKEEAVFSQLINRASPKVRETIRARVFEHNQERSLIEGMGEATLTGDFEDFAYCSIRLADFLTEHVRMEYLLFKELEKLLRPEDDRKILIEFGKMHADMHQKLDNVSAVLEELENKYRVAA